MLDYYKLFDYCKKISQDNNLKKERHRKNKESKQKKQQISLTQIKRNQIHIPFFYCFLF